MHVVFRIKEFDNRTGVITARPLCEKKGSSFIWKDGPIKILAAMDAKYKKELLFDEKTDKWISPINYSAEGHPYSIRIKTNLQKNVSVNSQENVSIGEDAHLVLAIKKFTIAVNAPIHRKTSEEKNIKGWTIKLADKIKYMRRT